MKKLILLLILSAIGLISASSRADQINCTGGTCRVCVPQCQLIPGGIPSFTTIAMQCGLEIFAYYGHPGTCERYYNSSGDPEYNEYSIDDPNGSIGSGEEFCTLWEYFIHNSINVMMYDCNSPEAWVSPYGGCPFGYAELSCDSNLGQGNNDLGLWSRTCDSSGLTSGGYISEPGGRCFYDTEGKDPYYVEEDLIYIYPGWEDGCFTCHKSDGPHTFYFGCDDFSGMHCSDGAGNDLNSGNCHEGHAITCYHQANTIDCY